jgi:hypothetical protein
MPAVLKKELSPHQTADEKSLMLYTLEKGKGIGSCRKRRYLLRVEEKKKKRLQNFDAIHLRSPCQISITRINFSYASHT